VFDDGGFVCVHEDEQPVEFWDPVESRMVTPLRPTLSIRAKADAMVAAVLRAHQARST
jgi:hypothetical protein